MVMRTMREQTKWIMIITAIAFVALMVFEWGMDFSGQSSAQITGGEAGRVNGEAISFEQFNAVYRNMYDQRAAESPEPIGSLEIRQLEQDAWDQLVTQSLIRQELRRRGIRVTDAEVRQAARYAPPPEFIDNELFQTEGEFDLAKYHQFLSSPAVDQRLLMQLEEYYRDLIPRNKLFQQIVSGLYITDAELWQMWRDRNESATVEYAVIDPAARIPDEQAVVTDGEIQSYYRANQDDFRRPASALVKVAVLPKAPTAQDSAAALERASGLLAEIAGGADFAAVAERESADPGSASQGGDLGTFARGQMVPAFDQAVWSLPPGQVSEPVLTQFGYHLIEVLSREGDQAGARHILVPIERGSDTEERLLSMADSLENMAVRMSLDSAAARLGITVRQTEINPELPMLPIAGRVDEGVEWAFEEAVPGEASPVFENPTGFYSFELVSSTPAGRLSLEEARPTIRSRLMMQKKQERGRELGDAIARAVSGGMPLADAAREHGAEAGTAGPFTRADFVPGLGAANAAIGAAFGLQRPGQTSGAVEAEGRIYVLRLIERTEADQAAWEEQKEIQRVRALQAREQEYLNRFIAELRDGARIVDTRSQVLGPSPATAAAPF